MRKLREKVDGKSKESKEIERGSKVIKLKRKRVENKHREKSEVRT